MSQLSFSLIQSWHFVLQTLAPASVLVAGRRALKRRYKDSYTSVDKRPTRVKDAPGGIPVSTIGRRYRGVAFASMRGTRVPERRPVEGLQPI